jgi:RHS repeat-associated protein
VVHDISHTLTPTLSATLAADDLSITPGDPVGFTSTVTNTGMVFNLGGDVRLTNTGSTTFVVGGFQETLEYQAVPSGVWTPFARAAYDGTGNLVPETTLLQLKFDLMVPRGDGSDVTYPTNPPNQNFASGATIAAGGNGHWGHIGPVMQIPSEVISIIFDPAQSSGLRSVLHFDVPSGTAPIGVNGLGYSTTTGDVTDVTATVFVGIASQPNQITSLTSSDSGPLAPGASRVFTATIASPVVTPYPAFPGEPEVDYVGRLGVAQVGYRTEVQVGGQSPSGNGSAGAPLQIAVELPQISAPVKTGPTTTNAGFTGAYSVTLPNVGHGPASALTLTDTVDGDLVTMNELSLPSTVGASATDVASFKLPIPLGRPAGPSTDVATMTWQDRNGNLYGPITASFTGNVDVGHPEGYLSINAVSGITDVIGVDKPFVVTALDPYGNPAPGVVVHFGVTGVNPQAADVPTGADGKATFTYSGTTMGNDTVVASATVTTTLITLDPIQVQWGKATGTPCTGRATPLDVMMVIDVSGSMVLEPPNYFTSVGKVEAAQTAAHRFIDDLNYAQDRLGLATFRAQIDTSAQLSANTTNAKTQLDDGVGGAIFCATNFCGGGGSNAANALNFALDELESPRHRPEAMKVVVYVGDGGSDTDMTAALARLRGSGARVIAIGIGAAVDGPLIRQIADSPNDYFYAPAAAGIDFAFNNLNQDLCRNRAPFVSAGGAQGHYSVRLPDVVTLEGEIHDDGPDGDTRLSSEWTLISGPGGVTFTDASAPVTDALFIVPGTYVLQLAASDGYLTVVDRATITVDPEPNLTGASVVVALATPSPLTTGTLETITATLRDVSSTPIPNFPVNLTVAGANPAQATAITDAFGVATFTHTGARAGTDQIHATALAPTFAVDSAVVPLVWNDAPIGGPLLTQGWIASPVHQSTIMGQVAVVLSSDVTLTSGTLTYWPDAHPDQVHTLATNLSGSPGATLATFDTTVLGNGSYVLALDGVDDTNHQRMSEVLLSVAGEYKPGRVVVEMTDFTVPIAGIPITIGRRYDSLEKDNVGDFGNGWSLTVGHPKLEVDLAHNIAITLPNGRRASFHFDPNYAAVGPVIIGFLIVPGYRPEPGVFGRLTANGCPMLTRNPFTLDPLVCFGALTPEDLPYAPTEYTYTDPYGTVYVMGATGEMRSIKDRQGNSLTFQPNGIISSAGKTVTFDRDAQGRITKVDYPSFLGPYVDAANYTYDAAGDLTAVQLPTSGYGPSVFNYTYSQHRLLTTVDPKGNPARTSTYDANGRLATDTDALGNVTSYTYNLATRTNTTTYPDTGVVTEVLDPRGLVLSETDPLGHTTTHEYDANWSETKKTNALGEETTAIYDAFGSQTSMTDPTGTTHTTYNDLNLPVTFVDRLGHATTIDYDDRGVPARVADELGTRFRFVNSEQGVPTVVEDAGGKRAYLEYDAAGNVTGRTDWLGRTTRAQYDEGGHKISETTARGATTTYSYLGQGWLGETRQPNGYTVQNAYDPNGNIYFIYDFDHVHGQTNPTFDALNHLTQLWRVNDGTTVLYERDFRGNPLAMTDENGHTTTYEYDHAANLIKTTFADGTFATRTYDGLNRLSSVTDERGHTSTYEYDEGCGCSDRLTRATDPLGHATVTAYDANGRRSSVTDANGHTTSFTYDVRGHVIKTDFPDGTSTHEAYDPRGRRISMTDQAGKTTVYGYDDQGQLTSVTDPLSNVTHYAYDLDGELTSVTDANGHTTTYEYDLLKRKTKRTLPLGQFETFAYNSVGNETAHTDFRGKTTAMTYDHRDRMLTKVPDPSLGEPSHTYMYSPTGMRLSSTDASGATTYTYDLRNRMLTKATTAGTLTYTYDATGNVATIRSSNANGTSVDYAWDAGNQLVSITDNRAGGATTTAYTPTRRPATLAQPNGTGLTYSYDALDRITSILWRHETSPAFGRWAYTHNERGQRLTVTDITGRNAAYGYDAASRLLSEAITGDPRGAAFNGALSYVLDDEGNRLSRTSTLAAITTATYSYDANDQLDSDVYDLNGNTTTSDGHTYAYDFENRLISKDNGAVSIVYDCDGNRVAKTVGGVTTRYVVDEVNPTAYLQVLEEVVSGIVQTRYTYGTTLISQTRSVSSMPVTSYYGYDGHGNVTFLTDASGAVTDSYDYDASGILVASTGSTTNTRLYAGEEFDQELGLINLRARQFRSETGRFSTIDPWDINPNTAPRDAELANTIEAVTEPHARAALALVLLDRVLLDKRLLAPVALNRYLYANGDAVNLSDPKGLGVIAEYSLTIMNSLKRAQIIFQSGRGALCGIGLMVETMKCYDRYRSSEWIGALPECITGLEFRLLSCYRTGVWLYSRG